MVTSPRTLAEVSESDLLRRIFPFFEGGPSLARRTRVTTPRSCAPVRPTVATTDSMVRGRDWLDEWSTAADVATKLLTQNLADVAAMGARPDRDPGVARRRPGDPAGLGGRVRPHPRRGRRRAAASSSPVATCPRRPRACSWCR